MRQGLGEEVGRHVLSAAVLEHDVAVVHGFTDEVEPNVDVLGAGVERVVPGERDGGAVVRIDTDREGGKLAVKDVGEDIP